MSKVTVIDYGVGNLYSVARALEHCGAEVQFTDTAAGIDAARLLILPGVGSFAGGMQGLHERGLIEPIRRYAMTGLPMMGICLGMQMLLEYSHEFGYHEGLGIIPGTVVNVPAVGKEGVAHKIPHIGWSKLHLPEGRTSWKSTVFEDLEPGVSVYFVHSFMVEPSEAELRLADCEYGGEIVSAAVVRGSVIGCQFHPEKSGQTGLSILSKFVSS